MVNFMAMITKLVTEGDTHYLGKITVSKAKHIFCLKNFNDYIIEIEKQVGKYRPDISLKDKNTKEVVGIIEIVDTRPVCYMKQCWLKNRNIGALALMITEWSQKYRYYPQKYQQALQTAFVKYVEDICSGTNNGRKLVVLSQRNKRCVVLIDNALTTLVSYEVISLDEENNTFYISALATNGMKYNIYFCPNKKTITPKLQNDLKIHGNHSLYVIESDKDCWIDSLSGNPCIIKY